MVKIKKQRSKIKNQRWFWILCLFALPAFAQHEHHQPAPVQVEETAKEQGGITVQELEQMALQQNPTLIQADATLKAVEGAKQQAGLFPNPTVGIQVEELSQRNPLGITEEHIFFFAEQTIPLGGKLGKSETALEWGRNRAEILKNVQRLKVINTVRSLYFEVLGAQQMVETQEKLQKLLEEASAITHELYNVGQADRPDVLEGEIEMQTAEVALAQSRNEQQRIWERLAASIGNPEMPISRLAGNLDENVPEIDRDSALAKLLKESPAVQAAQAGLEQSRAQIDSAKSLGTPDLRLRGGIGYNYEEIELLGEPVGWEGFFEVGITLPLFNRNQGNVAAASAEAITAEQEIRRLKLSLSERFAKSYADYVNARNVSQKYGKEILPRAREAYDLYKNSFQQMAAAYPQVLIAQRNLYQAELEYIRSLVRLQTSAVQLQNFLLAEGALDSPDFQIKQADEINAPGGTD
jgi:cobalt-zinc-cadmium efflux system outer membrane protein